MHHEHVAWPSPSISGARCGMRYSATRQFVSTTALHLRRGFCTSVLFIQTVNGSMEDTYLVILVYDLLLRVRSQIWKSYLEFGAEFGLSLCASMVNRLRFSIATW